MMYEFGASVGAEKCRSGPRSLSMTAADSMRALEQEGPRARPGPVSCLRHLKSLPVSEAEMA
jgi:hypothetical protein